MLDGERFATNLDLQDSCPFKLNSSTFLTTLNTYMKQKTRSILQELNTIAETRNFETLIESRAMNVISSAINLLESIHNHYDEDTAEELGRRLLNSIKGADPTKFSRGIRKIQYSRKIKRNKG